ENLHEGVEVLGVVGELACAGVDVGDVLGGRGILFGGLKGVDIDGGSVGENGLDPGEDAIAQNDAEVPWFSPCTFDGVLLNGLSKSTGVDLWFGDRLRIFLVFRFLVDLFR